MQCRLSWVFLCVVTLAVLAPRDASAVAMTPGSYVVSMKFEKNNKVYVRLAMYSFRSDSTFRADYWEWSNDQVDTSTMLQVIGVGSEHPTDAGNRMVGATKFVAMGPTVRFGTWAPWKSTNLKITWSDGSVEWWKRSWHDTALNKIELAYIGYATYPNSTHLFFNTSLSKFVRVYNAPNVGFGFGGATLGFTFAQPLTAFSNKTFVGWYFTWNRYCLEGYCDNPDPYQYNDHTINLAASDFTSTGVLRDYNVSSPPPGGNYCDAPDEYYYTVIPPGSTGMTARRVLSQSAHDFCTDVDHDGTLELGDGNIQAELGHLQNSLQIIDSNNFVRGLVTVETSFEAPGSEYNMMMMMSAMFAVDTTTTAAQLGIEDPFNW